MFNNKVAPDDYQRLRACFFNFASANELTINEAGNILERLSEDLQDQVCSGKYGFAKVCCDEVGDENKMPVHQCGEQMKSEIEATTPDKVKSGTERSGMVEKSLGNLLIRTKGVWE